MAVFARCCSFVGCRVVPILVLLLALFVGWLQQFPIPEGAVFEIIFTATKGQLPYHIFGQGHVSTPSVPESMSPLPRPSEEILLQLPDGAKFPQVGIGMCCRSSAYDPESVYNTVLWYLLQGGRHIDTAHVYTNHAYIGKAIKEAQRRGIPREDIFVTTKLFNSHLGYETPLEVVPTYLKELDLDYVDLVLLHFPRPFPYMFYSECSRKGWDYKTCRQETWKAMSLLKTRGVTRNVGVSNFNIRQLQEITELNLAPIANNQFQYNPWAPKWQHEVFQYCQANGIAVTAYGSFGGVFSKSTALTEKKIRSVAEKHKKSVAQILLRWAVEKGAVVIPGTGNPKHQLENLQVYSFSLDEQDMQVIDDCGDDEGAKAFFYINPDEN